jgi:hypothetical protein
VISSKILHKIKIQENRVFLTSREDSITPAARAGRLR